MNSIHERQINSRHEPDPAPSGGKRSLGFANDVPARFAPPLRGITGHHESPKLDNPDWQLRIAEDRARAVYPPIKLCLVSKRVSLHVCIGLTLVPENSTDNDT